MRDDADRWGSGADDDLPPLAYTSHASGTPADAQRMGLDRNTEEGALVAMAAALDGAKPFHRLVAWALLAAFSLPLLVTIGRELF